MVRGSEGSELPQLTGGEPRRSRNQRYARRVTLPAGEGNSPREEGL